MHSQTPPIRLLHRTTIALNQLHRLLQQATDILANLHSLYLVHTQPVDPHFQRPFPALPPAPLTAVPIPSPMSSCDSAPAGLLPQALPPPPPAPSQASSTSSPPTRPPPKKKRDPPPPLNEDADWDTWDADADVRLVKLKTDTRLRPNWNYVARRVGFSIEQCKARWEELLTWDQAQQQATTQSPTRTPPPPTPAASPISLASQLPQAPPSAPDFSYTPTTSPSLDPLAAAAAEAEPDAVSEDSHLEPTEAALGSYFV